MLIIYGKLKDEKRFKMYNIKENCFVDRKIYATIFHDNQREELQKNVDYMNEHNPKYLFEIRKA